MIKNKNLLFALKILLLIILFLSALYFENAYRQRPVSYTHLDVYKRQAVGSVAISGGAVYFGADSGTLYCLSDEAGEEGGFENKT